MTKAILATLALSGALAAPAGAATLTNSGGTLTFDGGPDTSYVTVTVSSDGSDSVRAFTSTPDAVATITMTGCDDVTQEPRQSRISTCPAVRAVVLNGGPGNDSLNSSVELPATISGGPGDDELRGGSGPGVVDGGPGDDRLIAGAGDVVKGGSGIDRLEYTLDGRRHVSLSLDGQANDGVTGEAINVMPDVEDLRTYDQSCGEVCGPPPPSPGVTLVGSDSANRLIGSDGDDSISGGGGSDELTGESGNDTFSARDGVTDRIVCGTGTDTVVADELDQVGDSCEHVQVAPAPFALEDKPPAITWVPRDRPLQVDASDDHAVAKVQFLAGARVLCTDTAAPFTCEFKPRAADVGRNTLIAIATDSSGQTATAVRAVTVPRLEAGALTLTVTRTLARGKLRVPAGVPCAGTVVVKAGATSREARLRKDCSYRVRFRAHTGAKVRATYRGTAAVRPKRSATVRA